MPHPPAQGDLESDGADRADTYSYALSGRLDTVHRGSALVSDYGFDDNGNRTSHRIGPASPLRGQSWPCLGTLPAGSDVTVSGNYDAQDRMSSYGSCSYEYTRNGELTRRVDSATSSTTEYDYDEFGNLRRVVLPDTRVITYHIDGLNRRVGKSINGVRQWGLLYANQLEPVAELDADGNVVASFIYADRPHVPSLMLKGGQTYRILADHLGSVRLVVNIATGAIAQRMTYDEYGNVVEDTSPGFQPFGYAGGIYDRDTGLVRFGARDYDAVAGRWTAKDPIGFDGGDGNLFAYVGSDPVNILDPTGLYGSFADCLEERRWDWGNLGPAGPEGTSTMGDVGSSLNLANATGNAIAGRTGSGISTASHATSWQHSTASTIGQNAQLAENGRRFGPTQAQWSNAGKVAGRVAILPTIWEGYWNIGSMIYCGCLAN